MPTWTQELSADKGLLDWLFTPIFFIKKENVRIFHMSWIDGIVNPMQSKSIDECIVLDQVDVSGK